MNQAMTSSNMSDDTAIQLANMIDVEAQNDFESQFNMKTLFKKRTNPYSNQKNQTTIFNNLNSDFINDSIKTSAADTDILDKKSSDYQMSKNAFNNISTDYKQNENLCTVFSQCDDRFNAEICKEQSNAKAEDSNSHERPSPVTTDLKSIFDKNYFVTATENFKILISDLQTKFQIECINREHTLMYLHDLEEFSQSQERQITVCLFEIDEIEKIILEQTKILLKQDEQLKSLEKIKSDIQQTLSQIQLASQKDSDHIKDLSSLNESLNEEIKSLKNTMSGLKSRLNSFETQNEDLLQKIALINENKQREMQLFKSINENERTVILDELASSKDQIKILQDNLNASNRNYRDLKSKWNHLTEFMKLNYRNDVDEDCQDLVQMIEKIETLNQNSKLSFRKSIKNLEIGLEDTKNLCREKEEEIVKLKTHRMSTDGEERRQLFAEQTALKSTIENLRAEITLQSREYELKIENMSKNVSDLQNEKTKLLDEIQNCKNATKLSLSDINSSKELTEQLNNLREDLKRKSADINECLKTKNNEISNIKKAHLEALKAKDMEIKRLNEFQYRQSQQLDAGDVSEILDDMRSDLKEYKSTPLRNPRLFTSSSDSSNKKQKKVITLQSN